MPRRLIVEVVDGRGRAARAPGLAGWLTAVAPARASGRVAVALVSDAHIRRLNHTFRATDAVTDVLSFPAREEAPLPSAAGWLGDVVIARGRAARQAREQGHGLAVELRVLALHGLLHLLGYDHDMDDGRMARVERRLRRRGGLGRGLIEREASR